MLNPIKTPRQMMLDQAGIPHLAGGGDILMQFAKQIQQAIKRYTATKGHPPSAEEVKQLEEHIKSLSQPSPRAPQTQARLAQQEPYASHLVDEYGRPYRPMMDPNTGRLTTPERARAFGVQDQFQSNPQTLAARKGLYEKNVNIFPPDEFTTMSNVGRTPSRTYQRSTAPSTEELMARQATEASDEAVGGLRQVAKPESYGFEEGPRSAMQPFAERAAALEGPGLEEIQSQLSTTLFPGRGAPQAKTPYSATVERIKQEFRARGIEPDAQDILNAIHAEQNPLRHNYTGANPIGQRPVVDPRAGGVSPEMQDWRQQMRLSGQSEREVTRSPSDWSPSTKRDYLLDTTPESRAPFAEGWDINALEDARRKRIPHKAMGGIMQPSPRDMRAQLLVAGQNPMPQPFGQAAQQQAQPFGQASQPQGLAANPQQFAQASAPQGNVQQPQQFSEMMQKMFAADDVQHFADGGRPITQEDVNNALRYSDRWQSPVERALMRAREENQPKMQAYNPTPRERIAEVGSKFLQHLGSPRNVARRGGQTLAGGPESVLPANMGLLDLASFTPAGAVATAPVWGPEAAQRIAHGEYMDLAMMPPALAAAAKVGKTAYQLGRRVDPRIAAGIAAGTTGTATNANEIEPEYKSVLERYPR